LNANLDPGMLRQHTLLLDRRVEAEPERSVPSHFTSEHANTHRQTL
jgi:hypothetical protein